MTKSIETVRTVEDLRARVDVWRAGDHTIAMVPTMGAIHEGHLSLVTEGRARATRVVASIFVNPLQFGPREDFEAYPRGEDDDAALLAKAGCALLFAPGANEMYPPHFSTSIRVGHLTEGLCGASREGHFDGVATVVTKLLLQCLPDIAIFGDKDYQQLLVIKRLARDLNIPVEIVGAPTLREADGLAMSSRNAYLSAEERNTAPALYRTLRQTAKALTEGQTVDAAVETARTKLNDAGFRIDYFDVRDPDTLEPLGGAVTSARVLTAAYLGDTRLIDNVPVPPNE